MLDALIFSRVRQQGNVAVQAAQADLAKQMREAAHSSPLDNRRLERQQVRSSCVAVPT